MRTAGSSINKTRLGFNSRPFNLAGEESYFNKNRRTQFYNVKAEKKNVPSHEQFNAGYAKRGIQSQGIGSKPQKNQTRNVQSEPASPTRRSGLPFKEKLKLRKKNRLAQKLEARMKVNGVNSAIFSVGGTLWLTVQLPFAILSTALLGMAMAVYSLIEYAPAVEEDDGVVVAAAKIVVGTSLDALRFVGEAAVSASKAALGFNIFSLFDPLTFFMITYLILFAIALIIIFTMYTAYKLMGLEPLGGKGSGLKYGAFLLTIIGYSLPLLNMFPWFMVWAGAVWFKPK